MSRRRTTDDPPRAKSPRSRQGLGPRGGPRVPLEPEVAAARYGAGEPIGAIAADFGRSPYTVRSRLREAGVRIGQPGRRPV